MQGRGPGCGHFLPAWGSGFHTPSDWGAWSPRTPLSSSLVMNTELQGGVGTTLLVRWPGSPVSVDRVTPLQFRALSSLVSLVQRWRTGSTPALQGSLPPQPQCSRGARSPSPADLSLSRLERGLGIGPCTPRDSRILIKPDARVLEAQPWGADQCEGNTTPPCTPGTSPGVALPHLSLGPCFHRTGQCTLL